MESDIDYRGLFLIAAGVFSALGGALDWNFFMESRRARFFVHVLGRGGARGFYVFLGVVISVIGASMMFGAIG